MDSAPLTLETLAVRVKALENESQKNSEAHGRMYERIEAVESGQVAFKVSVSNIENLCNEIKADVKVLKEQPAKRYNQIIGAALEWVIIALLSASVILK